jgi:hypothetical protein
MTPSATGRATSAVAVLGAVVGASYAGVESGTMPFSVTAYVMTAIPCAAAAVVMILQWCWPALGPWRRLETDVPTADGGAVPWLAVIALLVASELASYFVGGSRAAHPTISSGVDALFHARAAKAAAFLGWMALGSYLVRR